MGQQYKGNGSPFISYRIRTFRSDDCGSGDTGTFHMQFTGAVPTVRRYFAARAPGDNRPQQGRWTQMILPVSICDSNELVRANN